MIAGQLDFLDLLTDPTVTERGICDGPCPACGEDLTGQPAWRASTIGGHAVDMSTGHPQQRAECMSMDLTRNHCLADLGALAHLRATGTTCTSTPGYCLDHLHGATLTPRQLTEATAWHRDALARAYPRAAHVWRHHLDRLHAQLTPLLAPAGLTLTDLTEGARP